MSVYKDKLARFEDIFSHLSDSDEDENVQKNDTDPTDKSDSADKRPPHQCKESTDQGSPSKLIKLNDSDKYEDANIWLKPTKDDVGNKVNDVIEISSSSEDDSNSTQPLRESSGTDVFLDASSYCSSDIVEIDPNEDVGRLTHSSTACVAADEQEIELANTSSFFEDYNYKLSINRSGRYERFSMTYKSKICDTLKDLIDELAQLGKSLVLLKDGETIPLDSSPQSLKLAPGDMLDAIEVTSKAMPSTELPLDQHGKPQLGDTNVITLKLQDGNRKHSKEFQVAMDEPMLRLKQEYAKEFNIDISSMKLSFDGDVVGDDQTPEQLDIDDGCVIDVILPQTYTYVPPPSPVDLVSPEKKTPTRGRGRGRGGRRGRRSRGGRS